MIFVYCFPHSKEGKGFLVKSVTTMQLYWTLSLELPEVPAIALVKKKDT